MLDVYLITALDMLCLSLFIPVFGPHIISLGGNHKFMGYLNSSGSLIALIWNVLIGSLSDTKGRKFALLICLGFAAVGNLLTALSSNLSIVFLARLICVFGMPTQSILRTIAVDNIKDPNEKSQFFSKVGAMMGLILMFGSIGGGFISELENGSYKVFFIVTLLILTSCAVTFLFVKDKVAVPKPETKGKSKEKKENLSISQLVLRELKGIVINLKNINWANYWVLFSIKGCLYFCMSVMQSTAGLIFAKKFGIKGRGIGFVIAIMSLAGIISNLTMIKLKKAFYKNDIGYERLTHALIILLASYTLMGTSQYLIPFVAGFCLFSVGRGIVDNTLTETVSSKTTEKDTGSVMSALESMTSISNLIEPLLTSLLIDLFGEQMPCLLCTIPLTITLGLTILEKKKLPKPKTN